MKCPKKWSAIWSAENSGSHKCFQNCGLQHLSKVSPLWPSFIPNFHPTCPFISSPPASHLAGCGSVNVICHASVKHILISLALWEELAPLCYSWLRHPSCLWSISYDVLVIGALISLFENPCVFAPSRFQRIGRKGNKRDWCRDVCRVSKGKGNPKEDIGIDKACNESDVFASASSPRV